MKGSTRLQTYAGGHSSKSVKNSNLAVRFGSIRLTQQLNTACPKLNNLSCVELFEGVLARVRALLAGATFHVSVHLAIGTGSTKAEPTNARPKIFIYKTSFDLSLIHI